MTPNPKKKTYRNPDYLKYIRSLPCMISGKKPEAHHVRRIRFGAGVSQKSHDYCCVPLAPEHHNPDVEENLYVEESIINYMCGYVRSKYGDDVLIEGLMEFIESKRKK